VIHNKLINLYKDFLVVGGMLASILKYLEVNQDISIYDNSVKRNILDDYINDMSKYTTSSENIKIEKTYKSIPIQLGRDNNKFSYKLIEEGGRKVHYETSIDWFLNSQMIYKYILVEKPDIHLLYMKNKIFINDVGLLVELAKLKVKDIFSDESKLFSGILTENYVAQMINERTYNLNYWKSKSNAEIDFIRSINGNVVPIEVKVSMNTKSKSVNVYIERYNPKYSIRVSAKNFGFVNNIKSVPLYEVHLIKEL